MRRIKKIRVVWTVYPPRFDHVRDSFSEFKENEFGSAITRLIKLGLGASMCADVEVRYDDGSSDREMYPMLRTGG